MSDSLSELRRLVLAFREERDWQQFHNAKDLVLGLGIEVSELAELLLWKSEQESQDQIADISNRNRFAEELADIQIFLLYLANNLGVDLGSAVVNKIRINEQKYPVNQAKGSAAKYTDFPE